MRSYDLAFKDANALSEAGRKINRAAMGRGKNW
jgi:hypothetical protein